MPSKHQPKTVPATQETLSVSLMSMRGLLPVGLLSCWISMRWDGVGAKFSLEERVFVAKVAWPNSSQPCISVKALSTTEGEKQSWLLRYRETRLKNDFICCKKNKFYNRLIPAEGSGNKLQSLAFGFTSEKFSGKASGIYSNIYNDQLFLVLYIYFNLLNNFFYLLMISIDKNNFSLFKQLL